MSQSVLYIHIYVHGYMLRRQSLTQIRGTEYPPFFSAESFRLFLLFEYFIPSATTTTICYGLF